MNETIDKVELFKKALEAVGDNIEIEGDLVFVERLVDPKEIAEVKTAGGIIMSAPKDNRNTFATDRPEFVKVLAVGKGYYDEETNALVDPDLTPGNIIQVGMNTVKWFTQFGTILGGKGGVGVMREGERWVKFKDQEAFETFMKYFKV